MSTRSCLDTCKLACVLDCTGACKKIDTDEEGVSYEVDEFSTEHHSPNMTVIDDAPVMNGGW